MKKTITYSSYSELQSIIETQEKRKNKLYKIMKAYVKSDANKAQKALVLYTITQGTLISAYRNMLKHIHESELEI